MTITRVRSSNTNTLTASIGKDALNKPDQTVIYSCISKGAETITFVVTDSKRAASALTKTVTVLSRQNAR